jgi:hypothetical protein
MDDCGSRQSEVIDAAPLNQALGLTTTIHLQHTNLKALGQGLDNDQNADQYNEETNAESEISNETVQHIENTSIRIRTMVPPILAPFYPIRLTQTMHLVQRSAGVAPCPYFCPVHQDLAW